jgi:agmatinase
MPDKSQWFAGCLASSPEAQRACRMVLAGLPDDSNSSYRRGAAEAPARVRAVYSAEAYNSTSESGVELAGRVLDAGDLRPRATWAQTARHYAAFAGSLLLNSKIPFFIGGDHAVSVPVAQALAALARPVHVIQLDAHPDLYHEYGGSRTSHACVAARLLEMRHIASVTQFGVRTMNAAQQRKALEHRGRLHIHLARELGGPLPLPAHIPPRARIFLDVDMDAFDPAFAPGVAHAVPGGLTPRQALDFIQRLPWRLAGMCVVECNPGLDERDRTALLAARLLHEAMARASAA